MAYKVVIPQDITGAGKDYLREKGYEVVVGSGKTDLGTLKAEVADADALLVRTAPYPAEVIDAAPRLKAIGRHGVGVDNIDVAHCTKKGIWVTFAPESNANSVAEHAMGLIFALAHNIVYMDGQTRAGNWEIRNKVKGSDLAGKVLGIVGVGRIGSLLGEKAAFGVKMKVIGYDPFIPPDKYPEYVAPVDSIEEVFKTSDYISLHLPSNEQTKGLVNLSLLSLMKRSACLVNCARGEVLAEEDLYKVLAEGAIKGAALDVFCQEPCPYDNPLFTLKNIIVSPHNAALTQESMNRMGLHAAMGIHSALSGEKPQWAVNMVE
ncbi:MAG TPA: phosphoglycerate dehydrogenase [Ruminiclostridium sp.]|nr:phosphoglycerate dehydrogenase [Ruminiclostridium sp.]